MYTHTTEALLLCSGSTGLLCVAAGGGQAGAVVGPSQRRVACRNTVSVADNATRSESYLRKTNLERDFTEAEPTKLGDWLGTGR